MFGIDASDGVFRDLVAHFLNLAEAARFLVPTVSVKEG